ncbi:MAG: nucleotide-binding protein [Kiritimatiellaeota bacterium]|nr:nucleotide-binding protein [Kiritimatiellota bacterium]
MSGWVLGVTLLTISCVGRAPGAAVAPTAAGQTAAGEAAFSGSVAETMNSGLYTYLLVDTGSAKEWVAVLACEVKRGEQVTIPAGPTMTNFRSPTLKRDFARIRFVSGFMRPGETAPPVTGLPSGHPNVSGVAGTGMTAGHPGGEMRGRAPLAAAVQDYSGLAKPAGGKTVAEIYAEKKALAGQPVILRGKVVKYNGGIMNKNWLHLRDGTGPDGANDLTVVTLDQAAVGQTVLVSGLLTLDKDYGYGYKYSIIIENARVIVE